VSIVVGRILVKDLARIDPASMMMIWMRRRICALFYFFWNKKPAQA